MDLFLVPSRITGISNVSKMFPVLDGFSSFLVFFKFPEIQISAVKCCLSFALVHNSASN